VKKAILGLLISIAALSNAGCGDVREKAEVRKLTIGKNEIDNNRRHTVIANENGVLSKVYDGRNGVVGPLERTENMENQVKRLPGIVDAKMISYRNNIIVGVVLEKPNYREPKYSTKAHDWQLRNETKPGDRSYVNTDTYNDHIVKTVRHALQTEGKGHLLYITTDQFNYKKIAELKQKEQTGKPVRDEEYQGLISDIGFIMEPYNLLD